MKLRVIVIPILLVGVLQLSGCVPGGSRIPAGGVYLSRSAGANFDQSVKIEGSDEHIARFTLRRSFRLPENPSTIFIAAANRGLVVSENNGESWKVIALPLAQTLDVVILGNGVWVASGTEVDGQGHIVRSLDKGKSWDSVLTVPIPTKGQRFEIISEEATASIILSLERDPFNADHIYAGSNLGTILSGEQSAKVWKTIHTLQSLAELPGSAQGSGIRSLIPSPHRAGELLLITVNNALIRLRNGKQTTLTVPVKIDQEGVSKYLGSLESRRVLDVTFVTGFPQALLVATNRGAVVTRDDAQSWIDLKLPIDSSQPFNRSIAAVSPTNSNRILIAINNVIYRSEDSGITWNTFDFGVDGHAVTVLSIDPTNASRVFAILQPIQS